LLASAAALHPTPAEAACTNNAPASNETVTCSGANATGVIAPASTNVNLTLLTAGTIIPAAGSSISLGANANINLQDSTTTGSTTILNTYAVLIGNGSTVTINGTVRGQGGVAGPGAAGFANSTINLGASGTILTAGASGNSNLRGIGGGNIYQIDGLISATGTSGTGIGVGNNDMVTLGATGRITTAAGDTSLAISGSSATGVRVTTAAGSTITVNGLGLHAISLGNDANVEVSGTITSTGSAVGPSSLITGGIGVGANSSIWVKQGAQVLVATNPAAVANLSANAAVSSFPVDGAALSNSTIRIDGIVENRLGAGISGRTGSNITVGSTGRVSVLGGANFVSAIFINADTTTTANQVTMDISGRVENQGTGRGIFMTANRATGEVVETALTANVTIRETGVLAVQNNIAYRQDDGFDTFPEVIDNLVVRGTVSRSTAGTVIDLNDGADTVTIFPTAMITGNILGGVDVDGLPETDTFALDGAAGTTGAFNFAANQVTQFEAFRKQGAGAWTLTGNASFLNTAEVNAGTLVVNGTLTAPTTTVAAGATLGGIGTIVASTGLTVNGNIAPGNSIGTLNVTGPYVQASGSTYTVELNTTTSDLINVTGTATIQANATVSVLVTPGFYTLGQRYTILTASGGVTGQYSTLTDNGPFVDFALASDANNIFLDVIRSTVSFQEVAQTRNQKASASGVEALGPGNTIFDAVVMLDTANALRAFDLLSGEIHATVAGTLLEDSRFIRNAVTGRLQSIGGPAAIFAPRLAALSFAEDGAEADTASLMFDGAALGYAPQKQRRVRDTMDRALPLKAQPAAPGRVFAAWGQAFGSWGSADGDGNAAALSRTTGGFLAGLDVTFGGGRGDVWRAGLAGGYQYSSINVGDRNSSGRIDTYHLAAYGGRQMGPLGLRAGASYGWHDIGTGRSIVFPGFADATKANYDAGTAQVFGEVGYALAYRQFALEPFAGLAYVSVRTTGFAEAGGAAALNGTGGTSDTTYSTLGLRAAAPLPWRDLSGLTAKASAAWRHAFGTVTPTAELRFASGATPFVVAGTPIARDAAAIEFGLEGAVAPGATLGIAYTGQVAGRADDHGITANYVQRF
jgi:outer membrane autotransporter protein